MDDSSERFLDELLQSNEYGFDESICELEGVVLRLEDGALPLEQTIDMYVVGTKLVKSCCAILDRIEERIKEITR